MENSPFARFLSECTQASGDGLTEDELYGLHTGWCILQDASGAPIEDFWTAVRELGIRAHFVDSQVICPGAQMTGPAAGTTF